MTRYDKLKKEISAMSFDDFYKHFIVGEGVREYICGEIKHPIAHCTKNNEHDCLVCLKEYLKGEVK